MFSEESHASLTELSDAYIYTSLALTLCTFTTLYTASYKYSGLVHSNIAGLGARSSKILSKQLLPSLDSKSRLGSRVIEQFLVQRSVSSLGALAISRSEMSLY